MLANNSRPAAEEGTTTLKTRSQGDVANSSQSPKDKWNSLIPVTKPRRSSRSNAAKINEPEFSSTEDLSQKNKRDKREIYNSSNHHHQKNNKVTANNKTVQEPSASVNETEAKPGSSNSSKTATTTKNKWKFLKKNQHNTRSSLNRSANSSKLNHSIESSDEASKTDKELDRQNHKVGRKKSSERYKQKNNVTSVSFTANEVLNASPQAEACSSANLTVPRVLHKYTLRSQGTVADYPLNFLPLRRSAEHRNREVVALGASSSQHTKREDPEPSRLSRSGAVLRRSTRNSRGML